MTVISRMISQTITQRRAIPKYIPNDNTKGGAIPNTKDRKLRGVFRKVSSFQLTPIETTTVSLERAELKL